MYLLTVDIFRPLKPHWSNIGDAAVLGIFECKFLLSSVTTFDQQAGAHSEARFLLYNNR